MAWKLRLFTKRYLYLLLLLLVIIIIYVIVPSVNYTNCLSQQKFEKRILEGVVVDKYIDENHSTPVIILMKADTSIQVSFFGEYNNLYGRIAVGDTLKKRLGSAVLQKMNNGTYTTFGIASFNCNSANFEREKLLSAIYDFFNFIP